MELVERYRADGGPRPRMSADPTVSRIETPKPNLAFLAFAEKADAMDALSSMDGKSIEGQTITVSWAGPKPQNRPVRESQVLTSTKFEREDMQAARANYRPPSPKPSPERRRRRSESSASRRSREPRRRRSREPRSSRRRDDRRDSRSLTGRAFIVSKKPLKPISKRPATRHRRRGTLRILAPAPQPCGCAPLAARTDSFEVPGLAQRKNALGGSSGTPFLIQKVLRFAEAWFEPIPEPRLDDWLGKHRELMQSFDAFRTRREEQRDFIGPNDLRRVVHLMALGPEEPAPKVMQVLQAFRVTDRAGVVVSGVFRMV
eukprot:g28473.t1